MHTMPNLVDMARRVSSKLGRRYRTDKEELFGVASEILAERFEEFQNIPSKEKLFFKLWNTTRSRALKRKTVNIEINYTKLKEELEYFPTEYILSKYGIVKKDLDKIKSLEKEGKTYVTKKRVWVDPHGHPLRLEDLGEDAVFDEYADNDLYKSVFYENVDCFSLTDEEMIFIDLCFAGLDPWDDGEKDEKGKVIRMGDIEKFMEALPHLKKDYIRKGFYDRVVNKLKKKSPFHARA